VVSVYPGITPSGAITQIARMFFGTPDPSAIRVLELRFSKALVTFSRLLSHDVLFE
jgi:hypothetical protein